MDKLDIIEVEVMQEIFFFVFEIPFLHRQINVDECISGFWLTDLDLSLMPKLMLTLFWSSKIGLET